MAKENKKLKDQKTKTGIGKPMFSWEAYEFANYKKEGLWFVLIILVVILLAVFFVWQRNWTAVGVTVAAGFSMLMIAGIKPKKIPCAIYREGVVIGKKVFDFESLKSFWMIHQEHPAIRFQPQGRFSSHIHMPMAEEDPEQVRLFLAKHLPEDEDQGEDLADVIQRWIKF